MARIGATMFPSRGREFLMFTALLAFWYGLSPYQRDEFVGMLDQECDGTFDEPSFCQDDELMELLELWGG